MYKKFAALLLAAVMVFAMFGCKGATEPNPNSTVAPTQGNNDPAQTNTENNNATQNTEKVYTTYTQVYSAEVSTLNYLQSTATDVTVLGSLRPLRRYAALPCRKLGCFRRRHRIYLPPSSGREMVHL